MQEIRPTQFKVLQILIDGRGGPALDVPVEGEGRGGFDETCYFGAGVVFGELGEFGNVHIGVEEVIVAGLQRKRERGTE